MAQPTHQTYTEVIVYDRLTEDRYGTLSQQQVHLPSEGDTISLANVTANREPGDEAYQIIESESHSYIVTAIDIEYNAVEYQVSGEAEGSQLIEQVWIAVEPTRELVDE